MSRTLVLGSAFATLCCSLLIASTCATSQSKNLRAERGTPLKMNTHLKKPTTDELGGAERYLTFVSTDKPIYRAGEKVYVRGVMLDANNHKPMKASTSNATIQIKGPKGDVIGSGTAQAQDSVWGFGWEVPAQQAGGEYTINVTYPWEGHTPAARKFEIRAYRAPRLKSQITFLRDGYGPGEKVQATLEVTRAEGGAPEGAKVNVIARVDGMEINGATGKVDANGLCTVSFDLPHEIPRGEGTLALVIEDGGVVETASKTIPIVLQTVDLQMYPEGGDLVAGFSNRVYIQANQPNGKPADLSGKIMTKDGARAVADFKTEHEGRGRFEFTPDANTEYYLSISQPAGIKTKFPLPQVQTVGATIHSDGEIFKKNEPVKVKIGSTEKRYSVTLSKREVELSSCEVDLSKRSDVAAGDLLPVAFDVPSDVDGVLTVTVWNEKNVPIAERLVFRESANPLKITITPDKKNYVPGDSAKVIVKATDSAGKPVSAVVGLTVTDDTVLEMVEKREQAPQLPVMLFLEPEVKDLADAHVYLNASDPKAPLATDLLLATQGWRRFALMNLAKFIETNGDEARRAVALKIQSHVEMEEESMAWGGGIRGRGFAQFKEGAMPMPPAAAMPVGKAAAGPQVAAVMPVDKGMKMPQDDALDALAKNMPMQEPAPVLAKPMPRRQAAEQLGKLAQVADNELQASLAVSSERADKKRIVAKDEIFQQASNLIVVREFAHQVRANRQPTDRMDFTETLYWNAGVKTDEKTGEATIALGLNDSVTTFRVFADGFSNAGAVGAANTGMVSVQPFYAEAKLPLEVTMGDQILLPISLINGTANNLAGAALNVNLKGDFKLPAIQNSPSNLAAGSRGRWIQPINVGIGNGITSFVLSAKAGSFEDTVTRELVVKPKGFPIEKTFGGLIGPDKPVVHTINIPSQTVPASLVSTTAVYPTPLANLTEALERLIQDPNGCFEQTCSTSYPLTMAQQYFLSHTGVEPKLVEKSRQKLDDGYKKLVSFWCPDKGYEWFGENPGHEALTAFGLMHFTDMAQVREVDKNMISSTRSWLFKQRDGQGGFSRKRRALHTWIEDKDCSNAYIVWALLETGQPATELKPELSSLKTAATSSQNSYVLALAANAMHLAGDKAEAKKLMARLAEKQKADGSVDGIKSSIVGSGGEALQIEGTSLATLAWLREPEYAGHVEKSIKFLADSCKSGSYGSTQSTVLALRAIVTYDKLRAHPKAPGKVRIFVDGQAVGDWADFSPSTKGAIKLPNMAELLTPGEHKLELRMEGGAPMPYSLAVKYNAETPASDNDCKLDCAVKLAQSKVIEGSATEAILTVINKTKDVLPTPIAIVGLPGGLEPRHAQLKELVKKGTIDAYEVLGREVVLYWRTLPANANLEVPLSLIAAVPGTYTGPASRAYLYYTNEHKKWVEGVKVEIAAK